MNISGLWWGLNQIDLLSSLMFPSPLIFFRIFALECLRKSCHVPLDRTFVSQKLDVSTVNLDIACIALLLVILSTERSEPPVLGNNDLLAAREFILGPAKGLDGSCTI